MQRPNAAFRKLANIISVGLANRVCTLYNTCLVNSQKDACEHPAHPLSFRFLIVTTSVRQDRREDSLTCSFVHGLWNHFLDV